jgi:hypothetical protein
MPRSGNSAWPVVRADDDRHCHCRSRMTPGQHAENKSHTDDRAGVNRTLLTTGPASAPGRATVP